MVVCPQYLSTYLDSRSLQTKLLSSKALISQSSASLGSIINGAIGIRYMLILFAATFDG